jgi:hypothetical protein
MTNNQNQRDATSKRVLLGTIFCLLLATTVAVVASYPDESLSVETKEDAKVEADGTFTARLSGAKNPSSEEGSTTVKTRNDDALRPVDPPRATGGDYSVSLGSVNHLSNPGFDWWNWAPDAHMTVRRNAAGQVEVYWPEVDTWRTTGPSLTKQGDPRIVLPKGARGEPDNGGSYLFNVFQPDATKPNSLIGFVHAEDFEFRNGSRGIDAWKSGMYATSDDGGATWTRHGQFLTDSQPKPNSATFGGKGEVMVVRD